VIIAPNRMLRPNALAANPQPEVSNAKDCPFCRGHEFMTPAAVLTLPENEQDSWQVRVVPNRFPAITVGPAEGSRMAAAGIHEVVIESAEHQTSWTQLSATQRLLILQAYRNRLRDMHAVEGVRWGIIFKNQGPLAGASQDHVHSQVLGLSAASPAAEQANNYAFAYLRQHQKCVFCQLAHDELLGANRIVAAGDCYVAFCPSASRFAFEVWIIPEVHASRFEDSTDDQLSKLAVLMAGILSRLENLIQNVAFNFAIHSAPFDMHSQDHYHWHIVIYPRLARLAGLELHADIFINPVDPEFAAKQLRSD
jgi:UDPglucose--hexose-1-phosphate uridylyltransferase